MSAEPVHLNDRRAALNSSQRAALAQRLRQASSGEGGEVKARIPRRIGDEPTQLSFAQQRLWFLDQLAPGNPFYNIPAVLAWPTALNLTALQRALDEVVRRHEALRTVFRSTDQEPRQVVLPPHRQILRLLDLRSAPPARRAVLADEAAVQHVRTPFDLAAGPLLRVGVVRLDEQSYRLLLTMHHIVSDGWSMSVLLRELYTLYDAFAHGRGSPLPEPELQYADFAVWQRGWLTGPRLQDQLAYWRRKLAGMPTLELPTDFPRPTVASFRGDNLTVRVDPGTTRAVRALAAAEGATPFMVLLTAWAAVLHRATGQDDLAVGAPIANRLRSELENLIGFFVNSLVLRLDTSGSPGGRELLRRVKTTVVEAYAHQDLPFEKLVEELRPQRDLSRNPFTQVSFQLQNAPTVDGALPADDEVQLAPGTQTSILDLAFSLWETQNTFVGMAQFTTDLFEPATVRRLMDSYSVLLADLAAHPDTPISQLRLLTDVQRERVLLRSSPPPVRLGEPATLHELVLASCRARPRATAVQAQDGRLSYAELDRWSARVAADLRAAGVQPGDVVAVQTGRRVELVAAMLGVLRTGAAYLPLDPELPPRRTAAVLADAQVRLVLTNPGQAPNTSVRALPVPPLPDPGGTPDEGGSPAVVDPESAAYALFTSGSTGHPLGITVSHRALVNHMRWMQAAFSLGPDDRVLQRTPITFDASVWEFWAPLLAGARLVLFPGRWAADTAALVDVLRTARISVLQVVPSLLSLLVDEPALLSAASLRRVFCGGEALTPRLVHRFHQSWPDGGAPELVNLYGPTECTIDATTWRCSPTDRHARVPIGLPIANMAAYVLDQHQQPVPTGMLGELYLAGEGLSRGYLGRPELTAERFVPDPFSRTPRLMHRTRDLVRRRSDGALEFLGRADDLLKIRGLRIEPAEVERCLTEHPEVDKALVVARPSASGEDQLVAYVAVGQAADDAHVDDELVAEHVEDWRTLYQDVYGERRHSDLGGSPDPTFDTVGWNSSYDGEPLPEKEMRAWLDEVVQRVLALQPRRVLEIGSGTGLVALRVAPHCTDYVALDFSAAAVETLERTAHADGALPQLRVAQLAAHEVGALPDRDFDLVIVNSVVQYFPGLCYLETMLADAVAKLADGGSIFVGDVRSLPLLGSLHLSVLRKDDSVLPARAELEGRLRDERELVIDPRWFAGLVDRTPRLTSAVVRPKTTPFANELTRFRYDVVLSTAPVSQPVVTCLDWSRDVQVASRLPAVLAAHDGPVAVLAVPNERTRTEVALLEALVGPDGGEPSGSSPGPDAVTGTDPFQAVRAAEATGRRAEPLWTRTGPDGTFDLVTVPAGQRLDEAATAVAVQHRPAAAVGAMAATAPLRRRVGQRLVPQLRRQAEEHLPSYMVPAQFVILPTLPLLPNGKIARRSLPAPDGERPLADADYVPPSGALEKVLAEAWADVLGLRRVGARDDFFADLGGHSLLATQLVSRIRQLLRREVALRTVFEAPTVAGMAVALLDDAGPAEADQLRRRAALLLRVRDMSEDEAEELLRPAAAETTTTGVSNHDRTP